jgi:hypothetical protein
MWLGVFAPPAWADDFQLVDRSSGGWLSYAEVFMDDERLGYTDKYGRIRIDLPPGRYQARVRVNGRSHPFSFDITDDPEGRNLKIIRLDIGWE